MHSTRRNFLAAAAAALGTSMVFPPMSMGGEDMKMVQSDSAVLATQAFGISEKGTILLVMGATASMVWWPDSFCRALAAGGYQVIRFDHRDTGASTTGAAGQLDYDLAELAEDLIAILDAYDAPSAHLVGMSLGGLLAQIVALTHPERVSSLTLIASEPLGIDYKGQGISPAFLQHFATMETLDWSDREEVAAFMMTIAELSAGSALQFNRAAAVERIEIELDRSTSIRSAFNHALLAGEIAPELTAASLSVPVLAIHGSEDPIISPAAGRGIAEAIAGSELLVLEGRGHELAPSDLEWISSTILHSLIKGPAS